MRTNPQRSTPAEIERSKARFAEMDARAREKQMIVVTEAETTALMRLTREHGALDFEFGTGGVRVWIGPNRWAHDYLVKMRTEAVMLELSSGPKGAESAERTENPTRKTSSGS